MNYLAVFVSSFLLGTGLIALKGLFFRMALTTTGTLDVILNQRLDEDSRQDLLIKRFGPLIASLLLFVAGLSLTLLVALSPIFIYDQVLQGSESNAILTTGSAIVGGILPFLIFRKREPTDYSDWSKLLHRIVLDNQNISMALFNLERKKLTDRKHDEPFVIVTGLARAGTTALTNLLYNSGDFYSLSYSNMPFLLGVRTWRKFYNPKDGELRVRAHRDGIEFGVNTIEALEEYFFKAQTQDAFITSETLTQHEIEKRVNSAYSDYRELIRTPQESGRTYLAKNNNMILRHGSLARLNPNMKVVLLFRDPVTHASSLLAQHERFSALHESDPFALEYMNWLGHHEFGANHKPFEFEGICSAKEFPSHSIDHWVASWCDYYHRALEIATEPSTVLINYQELAQNPQQLLTKLSLKLGVTLKSEKIDAFKGSRKPEHSINPELLSRAQEIHEQLVHLSS